MNQASAIANQVRCLAPREIACTVRLSNGANYEPGFSTKS